MSGFRRVVSCQKTGRSESRADGLFARLPFFYALGNKSSGTIHFFLKGVAMEARFQHDCSKCVFLGQYNEFDLYVCPGGGHSTVIARFGDDGPEYQSGMAFVGVLDELTEAARRAVAKGLLDPSIRIGSRTIGDLI